MSWEYRKQRILRDILQYDTDIIGLHEVESEQFKVFYEPELKQRGYDGIFAPKSRSKTMNANSRKYVDGCALFWKTTKFRMVKQHLVEFAQVAILKAHQSDGIINRVMPKDNIALLSTMEVLPGVYKNGHSSPNYGQSGAGGPGLGQSGLGSNFGRGGHPGQNFGGSAASGLHQSGLGGLGSGQSGLSGLGGIGSAQSILGGLGSTQSGLGGLGSAQPGSGQSSPIPLQKSQSADTANPDHIDPEDEIIGKPLVVCAAHTTWDPQFCDVKLIQTMMLVHECAKQIESAAKDFDIPLQDVPLVLCGDFNSLPDSGPIEYLIKGEISKDHQDLKSFKSNMVLNGLNTNEYEDLTYNHSLRLESAIHPDQAILTNYT